LTVVEPPLPDPLSAPLEPDESLGEPAPVGVAALGELPAELLLLALFVAWSVAVVADDW